MQRCGADVQRSSAQPWGLADCHSRVVSVRLPAAPRPLLSCFNPRSLKSGVTMQSCWPAMEGHFCSMT
jgi:hypothetical protein